MSGAKVYTIEEIKEIYSAEKPKYLALKSPSGTFEVMFNNPKIKNDVKFAEIQRAIKKKTLPAGIYYVVTKNNFNKTATEHVLPLGVGNYSLADHIPPAPANGEKFQSIWSPQEAVKHLSEINKLTLQLENANKTIAELREEISELESELKESEELADPPPAQNDWINKIIEIGTPLVNKYFEQRDREINLLADKIKQESSKGRKNPDDPEYLEHLQKIIQSEDQSEIQSEFIYLKNNYPEFYSELCKTYEINPG